jgi:hypothetical protein
MFSLRNTLANWQLPPGYNINIRPFQNRGNCLAVPIASPSSPAAPSILSHLSHKILEDELRMMVERWCSARRANSGPIARVI